MAMKRTSWPRRDTPRAGNGKQTRKNDSYGSDALGGPIIQGAQRGSRVRAREQERRPLARRVPWKPHREAKAKVLQLACRSESPEPGRSPRRRRETTSLVEATQGGRQ